MKSSISCHYHYNSCAEFGGRGAKVCEGFESKNLTEWPGSIEAERAAGEGGRMLEERAVSECPVPIISGDLGGVRLNPAALCIVASSPQQRRPALTLKRVAAGLQRGGVHRLLALVEPSPSQLYRFSFCL